MFVLFCPFTFCLTKPIYCYYFLPCLVVLYGIFPFGRLISRSNGPYFSHDSHIVLFAALIMFCAFTLPYECTTRFDHPFIGKVSSNALSTVKKHFYCAIKHFVVVELGIFVLLPRVFRVEVIYYSLLSSCRFFIRRHLF